MAKSDSLIGQVLHETYKITRKIGTGGMSDVFEAVHSRLSKKRFAIKVLHPDVLTVTDMYERFRREAEITTELGHPNIVEVVDFNEVPSGAPYIVMEHLDGEDLGRRIRRGGPMPPPVVVEVMEQVGSALAEAHRHGIVHRDMKPENIFLVRKHNRFLVKVLDFGISKIRHSQTVVTRDHTVFGTPHYMSPEQAVGEVREIDHTTDIFALAVICYQMLSGKLPFDADSIPDVLRRVCTVEPTPVHELVVGLPPGLSTVLLRAMAKRKQERYQKIDAFVADVGICLVGPQKRQQIASMTAPPASRVPHPTEFEATQFSKTEPPEDKLPPEPPRAAKQGDTAPLVSAKGATVMDAGGAGEPVPMEPTLVGEVPVPPAPFALEPTALATKEQAASGTQEDSSDTIVSAPASIEASAFSADDAATKTMLGLSPAVAKSAEEPKQNKAVAPAKAVPEGASGLIELGAKQEPTPSVFEEQPTVMLSPQEPPSTQQGQTPDEPKPTTETPTEVADDAPAVLHEMRTMLQEPALEAVTTAVTKASADAPATDQAPPDLHAQRTMMLDKTRSERGGTGVTRLPQNKEQRSHRGLVIGMIAVVTFCVAALAYLLHDSDSTDVAQPDATPAVAIDAARPPPPEVKRDAAAVVKEVIDAAPVPAKEVVDAAPKKPDVAVAKPPTKRTRPRRPRRPAKKVGPHFTGDL